ncbi:MAG: AAA family ATPase [Candidatus Methanofastidiosia archaeon]|jgi:DNA repair exonuclease SbcCD ATPase subunit
MKFLSITLQNIRNFDEKTIHFEDGLNIVCGPNESGKSTIVDSILFSITGDKTGINNLVQWGAETSTLRLVYQTDAGQKFTLTRELYPEERSILQNNTVIEHPGTLSRILKTHFGSTSLIVLENSAVVKHNAMEIMRKMSSATVIKGQMRAVLSGNAERSTEEVIDILTRSITQIEQSIADIKNKIMVITHEIEPYKGADEEVQQLEEKKEYYREDIEKHEKKREMCKSRLWYENLIKEVQQYKETLHKAEDIKSYIESIPFESLEHMQVLQNKMKRIEQDKEDILDQLEDKKKDLQKLQNESGGGSILGKIFGSLFGNKKDTKSLERKIEVTKKRIEGDRAHIEQLNSIYQDIQQRHRQLENEVGPYRQQPLEELYHKKDQYQEQMKNVLGDKTLEELEYLISQKEKERDELRSIIFKFDPSLLEQDEHTVLEKKENLEEKITILTQEIDEIKMISQHMYTRKREKDRIQHKLTALQTSKEELEQKKEIDSIALDVIHDVYQDLKDQFIPQLEEKTARILGKITRGKYDNVSIDKETLNISVNTPARTLSISSLSQGTKDQLYLAVRIALSKILCGGRDIPLLFDESFYTSDAKRLTETFEVLNEIAQTTQILLYTHNEQFLTYGNSIILESVKEDTSGF